ncbi:hypothetical protein Y032_0149g2713 [Ancylostoma ceylanicum]|uniref:Uncharacterized protein n=1 Tax=Ancylostoma ceylanicum TaxID=53326 RepID=A0A016T1J7_9BILA|nr:hypothetical protein Y032_0149g2713 [Ancylostoma ceylanicum]
MIRFVCHSRGLKVALVVFLFVFCTTKRLILLCQFSALSKARYDENTRDRGRFQRLSSRDVVFERQYLALNNDFDIKCKILAFEDDISARKALEAAWIFTRNPGMNMKDENFVYDLVDELSAINVFFGS